MTRPRTLPLLLALVVTAFALALPSIASAAETVEFASSYSYGTNGFSHSVIVNVAGGAPNGTLNVLWSLQQPDSSGPVVPKPPVTVSLDGNGAGSASLTYTPTQTLGSYTQDRVLDVCIDDDLSETCDPGEPVPTSYTYHTVYVGEPYLSLSAGGTSTLTGATATYTVYLEEYSGANLGATVNYSRSGVNGTDSGTVVTNASGQAAIPSWTGNNPGQDTLRVWVDYPVGAGNGTYDSSPSEPTTTSATTFTEGTITLSATNAYYGVGDTVNVTATVKDSAGVAVADGTAVKYRIGFGAVQSATTGNGDGTLTIPVTSGSEQALTLTVWRDIVTADDSVNAGEPSAQRTVTFRYPFVQLGSPAPSGQISIGNPVTIAATALKGDGSLDTSVTVCWRTVSGSSVNSASGSFVSNATTAVGNIGFTGTHAGTDAVETWINQGGSGCGAGPDTAAEVVRSTSVTWIVEIASAGPVTNIYFSGLLGCQARYSLDTAGEFFGQDYGPASCGPFVVSGSTYRYYGNGFVPVSQTVPAAIGGGGLRSTLVVCVSFASSCGAGGTDPLLTQVVTYHPGDNFYRVDFTLQSRSGSSMPVRIYQYADCYLQNSDSGYGFFNSVASGGNDGIYCSQYAGNNDGNGNSGRIQGFVPLDGGSAYYEAGYGRVFGAITAAAGQSAMFYASSADVTNTCECGTFQDNGMALGWQGTLPAGGTMSRSLLVDLSPQGVTADIYAPNVTLETPADGATLAPADVSFGGAAGSLPGDSPTVTVDVYSGTSASGTKAQTLTATRSGGSWSVSSSSPLADGTYTAQAQQADSAGNVGQSSARTFTVATPPQPEPQPQPQPEPQPLAPPVFGQSANAEPVSGQVFVTEPGGKKVALTSPDQIRLGSIIDTTRGRVKLTIADKTGKPQSSEFYEGVFKIAQLPKKRGGILKLSLLGGKFKGCPGAKRARRSAAHDAAKKGKKLRKTSSVRHLWGSGSGPFRTQGRYSAATVRGTTWLTDDRCDGTLTRVTSGAVNVHDDVRDETVVVKKGGRYLAKPR